MAGKKESTLKNMVLTLFVITLVASTALGYIYEITKEPIAAAKLAKKLKAIGEVLPEFDNNPSEESYSKELDGGIVYFYPAKVQGELVGTAVETFTNEGFSGEIKLMVGFLPDGSIQDVAVLEHKETPGLGDKMDAKKSNFHVQFQGKNPAEFKLKVTKDGGNVDAITASTISSRAYCDAVKRAYDELMKGGQK